MSKRSSNGNIDKVAMAMVCFGILICGLSLFYRAYWFLLLGGIWIVLPVFFTEENIDEDLPDDQDD